MDIEWIDPVTAQNKEPFISVSDYAIAFNNSCYKLVSQYGEKIKFGKKKDAFVFQIGNYGLKISAAGARQDRGALHNYKTIGKLHDLGLGYGKYKISPLNDSGLFELILKEA